MTARQDYLKRLTDAQQAIDNLQATQVRLVWLRTALFLISAVCLTLGYAGDAYPVFFAAVGWLAAIAFLVAIVRHESLRVAVLCHQSDSALMRQLLGRLERNWKEVAAQELLPEFNDLAYADDLDVGGPGSLLSLLSLAETYPGRSTLQQWLATPAAWEDVAIRQKAVRQLVPNRDLRLSIIQTIRASGSQAHGVYGLADWSRTPSWLAAHPVARFISYLGPTLAVTGIVLVVITRPSENAWLINSAAAVAATGLLINILATVFWGSWIHDIFRQVTGEHRAVYQFASVFDSLSQLPADGGLLDGIRRTAAEGPACAVKGFAKLMTVVRLANLQRDVALYLLYLILQLLVLWDFRVLKLLERWKAEFGNQVAGWFEALGRCEALISCACLADEYPDWSFPESQSGTLRIEATELGHPLLPDAARVANDFSLDESRPLLLVTGSNMAGKSTFMRAVGLNLLMARTGGPVCAARFASPLFELATSIRVRDDLQSGVSFFMAELHRLKDVVDVAQEHAQLRSVGASPPPILFLLDEVLQGTNSRERQIAVVTVLEKLLNSGALGCVSTHDLDLAHAKEIADVSQVVHFREYFETDSSGNEVMRFDYRMRSGPTPTTNALKLLQLVGLDSRELTD